MKTKNLRSKQKTQLGGSLEPVVGSPQWKRTWAILGEMEFMECPQCAAKPGSPVLCVPCGHNRLLISGLKAAFRSANTRI